MKRNLKIRRNNSTPSVDKILLGVVLILVLLGLIAIADASAPQALNVFSDKFYFVKQQSLFAAAGVLIMFGVSKFPYSYWEKISTPLFIFSLILLVAVLIPGIGIKTYGARRWIDLGITTVQPSEFVKLTIALFMAKLVTRKNQSLYFFLPLAIVAGLIMLQPDLGTTIIISSIGFSVLFLSGINIFSFLGVGLIGAILSMIIILTSDYRKQRLMTFLSQSQDPLGSDYHIRQILLAFGSGGLFGVGLGQGRQKFLFLPESATDSIFATVAEELGFVGALLIVILFAVFIIRGLKIAKNAPDKFTYLLASGITTWITIQVLLNIGSMVALVPLTGVPLPFFSYGGTSLVMLLIGTGILLSISRGQNKNG